MSTTPETPFTLDTQPLDTVADDQLQRFVAALPLSLTDARMCRWRSALLHPSRAMGVAGYVDGELVGVARTLGGTVYVAVTSAFREQGIAKKLVTLTARPVPIAKVA